jgi:hypothetical protein
LRHKGARRRRDLVGTPCALGDGPQERRHGIGRGRCIVVHREWITLKCRAVGSACCAGVVQRCGEAV